jgi:uncharacterized Zn finger protein
VIIRKVCGKSGHEWQGCKCKKCGEENHDWVYIQTTDRAAGNPRVSIPGRLKIHIHECKACGKLMKSKHGTNEKRYERK